MLSPKTGNSNSVQHYTGSAGQCNRAGFLRGVRIGKEDINLSLCEKTTIFTENHKKPSNLHYSHSEFINMERLNNLTEVTFTISNWKSQGSSPGSV